VAVDAAARLYDVDEDTVVFKKLNQTEKYDQGVVTFRARKGRLVDLDKFHESIWASRLAHGTRSGLVSFDVVTIGEAIKTQDGMILRVSGSDAEFELAENSGDERAAAFAKLQESAAGTSQLVKVTGRIDGYVGRWPSLFRKKLKTPRCILVTDFETVE
jgi:hypothetical protein